MKPIRHLCLCLFVMCIPFLAKADSTSFNIDGSNRNSIFFSLSTGYIGTDYSISYTIEDDQGNWLAEVRFDISCWSNSFYIERTVTTASGVSGSSFERSPWYTNYDSMGEWADVSDLPASSFYKVTVSSNFVYDISVGAGYPGTAGWAWANVTHKDGNYGPGYAETCIQ